MTNLTLDEISRIARATHEMNRCWCQLTGDDSQLPWEGAPQWQKDSAMEGVRFLANNPDAPDSATHDSWVRQKLDDGWVYGPEKDADKKTHPCLVPYDDLPAVQRAKDAFFRIVVTSLLGVEDC